MIRFTGALTGTSICVPTGEAAAIAFGSATPIADLELGGMICGENIRAPSEKQRISWEAAREDHFRESALWIGVDLVHRVLAVPRTGGFGIALCGHLHLSEIDPGAMREAPLQKRRWAATGALCVAGAGALCGPELFEARVLPGIEGG